MPTIGFIGLGQMGKPMALNLRKAGFPVSVCMHSRPEPVQELVQAGARQLAFTAEVAASADMILLCLPDPAAVMALLEEPQGFVTGLRRGTLIVDHGTSGIRVTQQAAAIVAKRGCEWIDAPISGGVWGARAGTLTIMVGGEPQQVERARPVMEAMGKRIVHVGRLGAGQATKLVNNLMACINTLAVSEAFTLGVKAGVDVKALFDVIRASSGNNWVLENAAPKTIFVGNYEPGGRLRTMNKDLDLTADMAHDLQVPLFLGSLVRQLQEEMAARGFGENDAGIMARFYEEIASVSLVSPDFQQGT